MIQASTWSPRFRWQLPFLVSSCLASAASLFQFIPLIPTPVKLGFAVIVFAAALAGMLITVVNIPKEKRLMRVPMTSREMTIMFPLYGLTFGMLTARVVLLLR